MAGSSSSLYPEREVRGGWRRKGDCETGHTFYLIESSDDLSVVHVLYHELGSTGHSILFRDTLEEFLGMRSNLSSDPCGQNILDFLPILAVDSEA